MRVYRWGAVKDHGPTEEMNTSSEPMIGRRQDGSEPCIFFLESYRYIQNLRGNYKVRAEVRLEDLGNIIKVLVSKATTDPDILAWVQLGLASHGKELFALTSMAQGFVPQADTTTPGNQD